ncbi:MAG: hypothetical protein J4O01_09730 [Chloroflexi bacterium]|nr:hypothetical protein [Chloroflexota bacterium]MCH8116006.1 hypothetical protein [Chloroflexota bacterium]MCI0776303.1 hypothetical protein [Chloroflexota bacterium]MCI0837791.1 hypothetical protein [Chloroflexota bacterium]MCI0852320.1 hypothetical protein [Chloroflexota bacterium]
MSNLLYRNVIAGLGAGAVAAIVAILISLPLKSPDDILFNTASVGIATLGIGAVNGLLWHWSAVNLPLNRRYVFTSLGLLTVALAVAAGAQTQFDSAVAFTVPLALLAVLITVVATPFVAINRRAGLWFAKPWTSAVLIVVAVALSLALAGQGDQESGSLSLPPPP